MKAGRLRWLPELPMVIAVTQDVRANAARCARALRLWATKRVSTARALSLGSAQAGLAAAPLPEHRQRCACGTSDSILHSCAWRRYIPCRWSDPSDAVSIEFLTTENDIGTGEGPACVSAIQWGRV
eukprot:6060619-Pleurochrysis_carterae.AAC.1